MEQILPWQNMVEVIEPFYPKAGNGRRPYPLETMLRIHCMQHWYNLSDGAMEDASVRNRLHASVCPVILDSALPDRTTIMNFRHLLEQHPTGPPIVQDHQSLAGRSRRHDDSRHLGRCHHH
ncbi:transposase [Klebsiella quasipneumoniae]|uniref:transposase n=1 Tax=Klebsiella quasipneumoniae TaxID=1463165 RepID=UPI00388F186C